MVMLVDGYTLQRRVFFAATLPCVAPPGWIQFLLRGEGVGVFSEGVCSPVVPFGLIIK